MLKKQLNREKHQLVLTRQAATMFFMNIQSWKHQPFIQANYPTEMIAELEKDLERLSTEENGSSEIEWTLRQVAFEKQ